MSGSSPTAASPTPATAEDRAPAVAVAVSGGADSIALLWVVWAQASALGLKTRAFHVHHRLQAPAASWPQALAQELGRWATLRPDRPPIELRVAHLSGRPLPGQSVEEWAREGRYRALVEMALASGVELVMLAHHRQDQAETFLLQALRGAGPQGLAGMPRLQWRQGVCLARPWLDQPRALVRALAVSQGLQLIEDPSNEDPRWARNRLRLAVWPVLEAAFDQAEVALARAAARCAQALEPMEEGTRADWAQCMHAVDEEGRIVALDLAVWQTLTPARRSHVLRHWWGRLALAAPATAVDRVASQSLDAAVPQRWPLAPGFELRWYRGCLRVERVRRSSPAAGVDPLPKHLRFRRAARRHLPDWGGALILRRAAPGEPGLTGPLPLEVVARPRAAGDRFQLAPRGMARSLKKQFQARGIASWAREGPVLTDAQGALLWVAGLGLDARHAAPAGAWVFEWQPDECTQAGPLPP